MEIGPAESTGGEPGGGGQGSSEAGSAAIAEEGSGPQENTEEHAQPRSYGALAQGVKPNV